MLKNYFKLATRHLFKNGVFSLVNILGLTLGFGCFMLLSLYVIDELGFDSFHRDSDRIYRVVQQIEMPTGETRKVAAVAPPVGTEVQRQFPEIQDQTQLINVGRLTVGNELLTRDYEDAWIADANLFQFFDFEMLYGDPQTALAEPDNMVITESTAMKYFGRVDVVGERLYTNRYEATISGVIRDFPSNSHLYINTIHAEPTWAREISGWNDFVSSDWTANAFITYYKMNPGFDRSDFEKKLNSFVAEHNSDQEEYESSFELQPLTNIHLYSQDIEGAMNAHQGNPLYVYMFSILALLILAIACFNYMNLSTAAGTRRIREVGMRKTLGAEKWQLILQFTGEALLLSLLSLVLAVAALDFVLPYVNNFIGKELAIAFGNVPLIAGIGLVVLISGVLSALYPYYFLSRIQPATAVKKREIRIGRGSFSLMKMLVVAQFVVSIGMISVSIIIYQQLNYMRGKELGFQLNNLLVVDINSGAMRGQFESIKQEFGKLNEVESVTVSSRVPGEWKQFPIANAEIPGGAGSSQMIFLGIYEDFLQTYEINLVAGRAMRNDMADSNSVVLTESAVRSLGLEDPIGETIDIGSTLWDGSLSMLDEPFTPRVVGVVEDFYFESFREQMKPMVLASWRNPIHSIDYYTLRIHTADWQQTIDDLKAIVYRFDPENPMEYNFLDSRFEDFYRADLIRGQLFLIFSGIIIFIACMGLFALTAFSMENRIKEIGVRKVLGAAIADITWLLSSEFILLVGIAFLVSVPLAYWAVQSWLQEFAYRITVPWWAFPVAGLVALTIAMGTVSYHTIRAARMNPVESLRTE